MEDPDRRVQNPMTRKRKKLHGTVEEVINPLGPSQTEKVQINIDEADDLYREIRIENTLADDKGDKVHLKTGAKVEVIVEADSSATTRKPENSCFGPKLTQI